MTQYLLSISLVILLSLSAAITVAESPEILFFCGMKDGSENSEGVIVRFIVEDEKGKETQVFEQHWDAQEWSSEFVVDLKPWAGSSITLNLTTDPGPARNTGWDWILIGDAKIEFSGKLIYDIGQAVADGEPKLSCLLDGDKKESDGILFDGNCTPDAGTCGGKTKPKSFMQHPPWNGRVGNSISRYDIDLPGTAAVDLRAKATTTWGQLKHAM